MHINMSLAILLTITQNSVSLLDAQGDALKLALQDLEDCVLDQEIQLNSTKCSDERGRCASPPAVFSARTLRSFVDENGVDRLKLSITDAIDHVQIAQQDMRNEIARMSNIIGDFKKDSFESRSVCAREKLEHAYNQTNLIASAAHEMATLLESLARHYDQCTQAYDLSLEVMSGKYSADISEELEELTEVLSNDARELDGVLAELYEHRESIAISARVVVDFLEKVELDHSTSVKVLKKLDSFGLGELAEYEARIYDLGKAQSDLLDQVNSILLPEMASLVEYYRLFLQSYYSMVLEISRRKHYYEKLKNIQEEIQRKVDKTVKGKFLIMCVPFQILLGD